MTQEEHERRITGLEVKVSVLDDRQQALERAVALNAQTQRTMARLLKHHDHSLSTQDAMLRGDGHKDIGLASKVSQLESSDKRRSGHIKWILGTLGTVITTLVGAAASWAFGLLHK